MNILDHI